VKFRFAFLEKTKAAFRWIRSKDLVGQRRAIGSWAWTAKGRMADTVSSEKRSETMRAIRSANTGFEMSFRMLLRKAGLAFSTQNNLPGKPDLIFRRAKVAVFLDSCFWHGCRWHCRMPKSNSAYWNEKIDKNRRRDRAIRDGYRKTEWAIARIWEHSIRTNPQQCIDRLRVLVQNRLGQTVVSHSQKMQDAD
jgi:DNA mismatch endonuclease (patch repair protein)